MSQHIPVPPPVPMAPGHGKPHSILSDSYGVDVADPYGSSAQDLRGIRAPTFHPREYSQLHRWLNTPEQSQEVNGLPPNGLNSTQSKVVSDKKKNGKSATRVLDDENGSPVETKYEGFLLTAMERPEGQRKSWSKAHYHYIPVNQQSLKRSTEGIRAKTEAPDVAFRTLGPLQQKLVNRLIAVRNAREEHPNAEWTLVDVDRRMDVPKRSRVRETRDIRVILRRDNKTSESIRTNSKVPYQSDDIIDLSQPPEHKKDKIQKKSKESKSADINHLTPWNPVYIDSVSNLPPAHSQRLGILYADMALSMEQQRQQPKPHHSDELFEEYPKHFVAQSRLALQQNYLQRAIDHHPYHYGQGVNEASQKSIQRPLDTQRYPDVQLDASSDNSARQHTEQQSAYPQHEPGLDYSDQLYEAPLHSQQPSPDQQNHQQKPKDQSHQQKQQQQSRQQPIHRQQPIPQPVARKLPSLPPQRVAAFYNIDQTQPVHYLSTSPHKGIEANNSSSGSNSLTSFPDMTQLDHSAVAPSHLRKMRDGQRDSSPKRRHSKSQRHEATQMEAVLASLTALRTDIDEIKNCSRYPDLADSMAVFSSDGESDEQYTFSVGEHGHSFFTPPSSPHSTFSNGEARDVTGHRTTSHHNTGVVNGKWPKVSPESLFDFQTQRRYSMAERDYANYGLYSQNVQHSRKPAIVHTDDVGDYPTSGLRPLNQNRDHDSHGRQDDSVLPYRHQRQATEHYAPYSRGGEIDYPAHNEPYRAQPQNAFASGIEYGRQAQRGFPDSRRHTYETGVAGRGRREAYYP